ncbi:hypothetical protein DBR47_17150 [Paucibacter sp. KBW04]|uniref:acetoacetate decarboxylase family protein n=1 Tax=Paucibacter sp. KBW04 TaxID=2153361 RepID=UPI000F5839B3|nr:acetoacetate decarboxylase family protein [Paucibacter sp. KBW04]RQO56270.1 hypothetical protein DBR47_17150 [Paucibacter sp. KBW04]
MNTWQADPFFQYPLSTQATSEGEVDLPILYYDNSNMIAMFWVELEAARKVLAATGMSPIQFASGKALLALAFYEYRETAIAPYNEMGVAIAALPTGQRAPSLPLLSLFYGLDRERAGFYVIDLPVTTAVACAAGREIWGYPKFVTPIGFELNQKHFNGTVSRPEGGGDLLSLSGKAGMAMPGPLLDLVLYSSLNSKTLRTLVNTRGGGQIALPGSLRLRVSRSEHPMVQRLLALGLEQARPAFVSYTHKLQLRLNAGAVLP